MNADFYSFYFYMSIIVMENIKDFIICKNYVSGKSLKNTNQRTSKEIKFIIIVFMAFSFTLDILNQESKQLCGNQK